MTVNKERVALLVDALRDPAAKQGFGRLATEEGYCCLGIACELAIASGLDINREVRPGTFQGTFEIIYDGETLTLPESVRAWYGFRESDPKLGVKDIATSLNDDSRLTFPEIANRFEDTFLAEEPTL